MKTSIAIADDHHLVAQALTALIQKFDEYEVLFVAENGRDLIQNLRRSQKPDILLLDISMPDMDGFETAHHLKQHYPDIRVIVLTMADRQEHIYRMVRNGVRGYLLKGCRPHELRQALDDVRSKGYHYSEFLTSRLVRSLNQPDQGHATDGSDLNNREYEFLKLACSDLTYAQIADKMCVSTRTVDGYREAIFHKMSVKSRTAMALEAVRRGLVQL